MTIARLIVGVVMVWCGAVAMAAQRIGPILPPGDAMDSETIKENDRARLSLESNEVPLRGKASFVDPVKIRLGSHGHTKGVVSFEMQRRDGVWEEVALIIVRQDERERADPFNRSGELEISVRHDTPGVDDDKQFIPVALFRWDGITLYVPIVGAGPVSQLIPGRLYSGDGKVCLNLQSDQRGGLVCYDTNDGSLDETSWRPVWALRNGALENFT